MATRSTIALEFADGTVQQVYCHWDGYLEHNGKILFESYQDPFKLRDLIDLGDVSVLARSTTSTIVTKKVAPFTVVTVVRPVSKLANLLTSKITRPVTNMKNTSISFAPMATGMCANMARAMCS
jgi:hypothetical protein